jgi:hypothetical protein
MLSQIGGFVLEMLDLRQACDSCFTFTFFVDFGC